MKKIIIAALVMMLVCSASVFAIYSNSNIKDYGGLNVGVSYVYDKYKVGDSSEVEDQAGQLGIGLTDFTFFGESNLGVYFDANVLFTLKDNNAYNDDFKSPVYANLALGLAFKSNMGSSMMLLGGAGVDFMYFSRQNKYYVMHNFYVVERTYVTLGVFADLEIAYKVARDIYVSLGAKGNLNFAKWVTTDATDYWGEHTSTETKDTDGYFGYRVTPKVSVLFVF